MTNEGDDRSHRPGEVPSRERRVRLRPANVSDAQRLLEWRNDPQTIAMSRQTEAVSPERHEPWLRDVLARSSVRLFVAEDPLHGDAVGTGRLDRLDAETVELSLTVAPRWRGQGYGTAIIAALVERTGDEFPGVRTLRADVRPENQASIRAFARFEFVAVRESNGFVEMAAPMRPRRS